MRKKYENKTPKMQFLHKYTGAIILGFIGITIILIWGVMENEKVFFENWSCNLIVDLDITEMTEKELERHAEIMPQCDEFTPPT